MSSLDPTQTPSPPERRFYGAPVSISVLDYGGDGPPILMHHANGFCGGMWSEVAEALVSRFRVFAVDARGHGESDKPDAPGSYHWERFAEDLANTGRALLRELGVSHFELGIGHSFGGTSTLGAAAREPGLYRQILLLDPVIPPPPRPTREQVRVNRGGELAAGARRRRQHWPSREAARRYFVSRSFFDAWTPRALDLYVEYGLLDSEHGVSLACPGEVEASIFEANGTLDLFALAPQISVPATFLWATRGDFPRPLYEALASKMKSARVEDASAGHLIVMEEPNLVVEVALRMV